jgi:hypothetical protein
MTHPRPLQLFNDLKSRVSALEALGKKQQLAGSTSEAESIFRACIVLTVSAFDAFMHEKASELFLTKSASSPQVALSVAAYLNTSANRVIAPDAASVVRYHLSFKTLVATYAIDKVISTAGNDSAATWRDIGILRGHRESRLRNSLDLFVDRRNQIAHEGDWDPASLELRHISETHVYDCQEAISAVAEGIDSCWL